MPSFLVNKTHLGPWTVNPCAVAKKAANAKVFENFIVLRVINNSDDRKPYYFKEKTNGHETLDVMTRQGQQIFGSFVC